MTRNGSIASGPPLPPGWKIETAQEKSGEKSGDRLAVFRADKAPGRPRAFVRVSQSTHRLDLNALAPKGKVSSFNRTGRYGWEDASRVISGAYPDGRIAAIYILPPGAPLRRLRLGHPQTVEELEKRLRESIAGFPQEFKRIYFCENPGATALRVMPMKK